jgi:hypothetical protein
MSVGTIGVGISSSVEVKYSCAQCCGSGIRCLLDPWIRDPGWVKSQDPDPGWTNRIIFPRAWKPVFWVKILTFFDAYLGSGMKKFGSGIRDGKKSDPGSGINIPDPQHCVCIWICICESLVLLGGSYCFGSPLWFLCGSGSAWYLNADTDPGFGSTRNVEFLHVSRCSDGYKSRFSWELDLWSFFYRRWDIVQVLKSQQKVFFLWRGGGRLVGVQFNYLQLTRGDLLPLSSSLIESCQLAVWGPHFIV